MKHKFFTFIMTITLLFSMVPAVWASTDNIKINTQAPQNVCAQAKKNGTIVVKWGKVANVSGYEVYRSTSANGTYKLLKSVKGSKYTDKKIHPKKTYFYKITAKNTEYSNTVEEYTSPVVSAKLRIKKSFKVKAYAYTGGGTTKTGKKAKVGRIAVDPKVIKLGTWLYVEGYGICQACDIGGNIKGKTIDVYKNTKKQTRKWGVRKPKVYIIS